MEPMNFIVAILLTFDIPDLAQVRVPVGEAGHAVTVAIVAIIAGIVAVAAWLWSKL